MNRKALIVVLAVVMAISALVVFAQDGTGVIQFTLPDGKEVPVFTDGRINAFDIGAPVVLYYTSDAGTILSPSFSENRPGVQNPLDLSVSGTGNQTAVAPVNPNSVFNSLQLLAISPMTANGDLVLEASIDDLENLVTGDLNSISDNGYTLNYNRQANWFWISTPPDFEGKVYTFAWENNLFPRVASPVLPSQSNQIQATSQQSQAQPAQVQPTTQPVTQPTSPTYP